MTVLKSEIDTRSEAFQRNRDAMQAQVEEVRRVVDKIKLGGGEAGAEEMDRRLVDPDFARRIATVEFVRNAGELRFIIRDQGKGFDWQQYLEMSPERAFDTHGRGIAMSKLLSFDKLEYRGCGNEVEGVVNLPPAVTPPESTSTRH